MEILSKVGEVVTETVSWAGDIATVVVGNELLLFGALAGAAGIGIGLFKALFSR